MIPTPSPINLEEDQELITLLEILGHLSFEYPSKLFAARRTAFIAQVDQREKIRSAHQFHSKNKFIQHRGE